MSLVRPGVWPWIGAILVLFVAAGAAAFFLPPTLFAAAFVGGVVILAWLVSPKVVIVLLLLVRSSIDGFMELFQLSFTAGLPLTMNLAGAMNSLAVGLGFLTLAQRLVRRQPLLPTAPGWTYALFLAVCLPMIPGSVDPVAGVKEWARLASGLAIYLMATEVVHDERQARRFTVVILASSLLPLAVGWLQRLTGSGYFFLGFVGTEFAYRPQGTFAHPGILGSYLVIMLTMATTAYFGAPSAARRAALIGWGAATAGCLALTLARTEWLGFLVAMTVLGLLKQRRLAIMILVCAAVLLASVPLLRERLTATESVFWRLDLWQAAYSLAWPPSFLGLGLGTSPWHVNQILPLVDSPPHNDYLKVLLETGLLALLAYLGWLLALLRHAWRAYCRTIDRQIAWRALGLLAITAAGAVMSLSDNYLGHTAVQWYFWAFVALVPPSGTWPPGAACLWRPVSAGQASDERIHP